MVNFIKFHLSNMTRRHWYICLIILLSVVIVLIIDSVKNNLNQGKGFYKHNISAQLKEELIAKNVWSENCPISIERLRLLTIPYYNFAGKEVTDGKLIVLDIVAERVLNIFRELHKNKFPIANMKLMTEYMGDDNLSMADNNTSSFNCRLITGGEGLSSHYYGLAIDINPIQNPYINNEYEIGKLDTKILPPAGMQYINRSILKPGMVENAIDASKKRIVVDVFYDNGFRTWGGKWNFPVDLHHFQIDKEYIKKLATSSPEEGLVIFETMTKNPNHKSQTLEVDN